MSKLNSKNKTDQDVDLLLKTIDEKNEQMTRLQNKFRDVTHAYKSLLEEKKALEITIKALKTSTSLSSKLASSSNSQMTPKAENLNHSGIFSSSRSVSASDLSEQESIISDNDNINSKLQHAANLSNQEDKIAALTSNIQLLISNKSKLEQNFQAERKKLRQEFDELNQKFENSKLDNEKNAELYESRIKELRVSLKQSQLDREKLTSDLNMMLKAKSAEQENKILSMHEENQSLLLTLRNENNDLKFKLKNLTRQFENKCEEVVQCEKEYKNLKDVLDERSKQDESCVTDLRKQLKQSESTSETRISILEAKLSELCSLVAKYESSNNNVSNYNLNENKTYSNYLTKKLADDDEDNKLKPAKLDFNTALEQITQLKSYIETTAKELNINFNFNEIWIQNGIKNLNLNEEKQTELLNQIEKLKDENRHLKEEYEKYKIRTNYLIKSARQLSSNTSENEQQQTQLIQKLKDEIDIIKNRLILNETKHNDELKHLKDSNEKQLTNLRTDFRQQFEKQEHERFKSLNDLEKELVKQRERTMKLLDEKENELQQYREQSNLKISTKLTRSASENVDLASSLNISIEDDDYKKSSLNSPTSHNNSILEANRLIYYSQEAAYKETELNKLRIAKTELEYKLKQTFDEHSVDIERLLAQINILKQEIERIKLNQSRAEMNGSNLEYIKNVVYNYMTTKDANVKLSMQTAITQILHFTKSEKQKLSLASTPSKPIAN